MQIVNDRVLNNTVIVTGTSAGSMVMCSPMYGGGITYGHLYFAEKVGLASKNLSAGETGGSGFHDMRNGTSGLQYEDNGAYMFGFGFVPFLVDTHVDARGRLGRIVPSQVQLKRDFGVGIE